MDLFNVKFTHQELLKIDNRELLLEYRMVNNCIKDFYSSDKPNNNEFDMLLNYRQKLQDAILEKMESYK